MKRNFLFAYYRTPRGALLRQQEVDYLQRAITVSCKQTILQIGGLGWENEFIDCALYKSYFVLDVNGEGNSEAKAIRAESNLLPLLSDSVDMVILPHLLEFDPCRLQTMREVERVLKPEGKLVVINFNPWSLRVRYEYLWDAKKEDWRQGHFISRSRLMDWLKLLNFEMTLVTEFTSGSIHSTHGQFVANYHALAATAYAVKAIKRRYNVIPLTPVKEHNPCLVLVNSINSSTRLGS